MKNWKTTIGSWISVIGLIVTQLPFEKGTLIGGIITGIGTLITGHAAQDKQ